MDEKLDSPDAQPVARGQLQPLHATIVDEGAVRALEVLHFEQAGVARGQAAVHRETSAASRIKSAPMARPMVLMAPGRMRKVSEPVSDCVGYSQCPHGKGALEDPRVPGPMIPELKLPA